MRRKNYVILFICIIVMNLYKNFNSDINDLATYVITCIGLGVPQFSSGYMVLLALDMFPVLCIEIVEGISIYKHYTVGSAYYFIRQKNRKKWYKEECLKMFRRIALFYMMYGVLTFVLAAVLHKMIVTKEAVVLLVFQCIVTILYLCTFSLLLNCISIITGSESAYCAGIGVQLLFIAALMFFGNIKLNAKYQILLNLNPIACIILSWHKLPHLPIMNDIEIELNIVYSMCWLTLLGIVIYFVGKYIVFNKDVAIENKEEMG